MYEYKQSILVKECFWHSFSNYRSKYIEGNNLNTQNLKTTIMKQLFIIAIAAISFASCKSKETTNKDLILLTDSSGMNGGSYLTDTGAVTQVEPVVVAPPVTTTTPRRTTTTPRRSSSTSNSGGGTVGNNSGTSGSGGGTVAQAPEKQGMSKAAKGAIIGGVGGAAAGAIIGRNAKGAIIGGAVGAAGGYIIGRKKDKADGRVQ